MPVRTPGTSETLDVGIDVSFDDPMEAIGMTVSTTDQTSRTGGEAAEATRRLYLVRTEVLVRAGHTADFERHLGFGAPRTWDAKSLSTRS